MGANVHAASDRGAEGWGVGWGGMPTVLAQVVGPAALLPRLLLLAPPLQVSFMPILVLAARLCPPGVEATVYATLMSCLNGEAGTSHPPPTTLMSCLNGPSLPQTTHPHVLPAWCEGPTPLPPCPARCRCADTPPPPPVHDAQAAPSWAARWARA